MRIDIVCFTDRGWELAGRLMTELRGAGDLARLERCGRDRPVRQWAAERFQRTDALVFVGAVGIAVRAVAPLLVSKTSDPAVVSVDDCGKFAVPVLSGHIGGANELAERIAGYLGATPVITTATDGSGVFAVDVWARRKGFAILNPGRIKNVSAKLLSGEAVGMSLEFPIAGEMPEGVVVRDEEVDIRVGIRKCSDSGPLLLVPPIAVLGVGCRKGTATADIENAFLKFCRDAEIWPQAFGRVCSIDIKKDEPGLVEFCAGRGLPFETFGAGELGRVEGEFASSAFVAAVTGVDNVCERSAVAGSGGGRLIAGKTVADGVTMAAAIGMYTVDF